MSILRSIVKESTFSKKVHCTSPIFLTSKLFQNKNAQDTESGEAHTSYVSIIIITGLDKLPPHGSPSITRPKHV